MAVSVHPGPIMTNLQRHIAGVCWFCRDCILFICRLFFLKMKMLLIFPSPQDEKWYIPIMETLTSFAVSLELFKTIPQGAATQFYCAVAPRAELVNGAYYQNGYLSRASGNALTILADAELTKLFEQHTQAIIEKFL